MSTRISFIGLGRMGLPMARHIMAAGYDLLGFDVGSEARQSAAAAGLAVQDAPVFAGVDLILTSLPDTPQVEEVYAAPGGAFATADPGTICVDLSTISPRASARLAGGASTAGLRFLDAPVSGTSIHAEAGSLVVMVGGEDEPLATARPVIESFATAVHHIGPNGAALTLKLIVNRLLTTHLAAIAEAVVEMETVGLDVQQGLDIMRDGPVPRLLWYKAAPLAERDYTPQFTVDLMRKDLRIAAGELPSARLGDLSRAILEEAAAAGNGGNDLASLIDVIENEVAAS